ncbi:MAG: hypothetical protein AAB336_00450 [Acidobacteriota bacterium]
MSEPIIWKPGDLPYSWDPYRALPILKIIGFIDRYLNGNIPIKREHLLVIFFHETGFCNVRQNQGKGPAVGFGQMEIFNGDKIPFFETLRYNSAILNPKLSQKARESYTHLFIYPPLTYESVLNDDEFAIKMHCSYFNWLFENGMPQNAAPGQKGIKSLRGLLMAQTGGGNNLQFVDHFVSSGDKLKVALGTGDRAKIIDALNSVRHYLKEDSSDTESRPLTLSRYPKYWDFILPESDVKFIR